MKQVRIIKKSRRPFRCLTASLVPMLIVALLASPALAAPPSNDEETSPKVITKLPYTDKIDATNATEAPTDPTHTQTSGGVPYTTPICRSGGTVWYQFTAKNDVRLVADTFGSDFNTILAAFEGQPAKSTEVGCNDDWRSRQSRLSFEAKAGRTYNFVVSGTNPGLLVFNLRVAIPPKNDEIARATNIKVDLPFKDRVDTTDATLNVNDPSCSGRARSVWYRYERPKNWDERRISISTRGSDYYTALSVYTGPRYALNQIECDADNTRSKVRFLTEPGKVYWVMVSAAENSQAGSLSLTVKNMPIPFKFDVGLNRTGRISAVTGATHIGGKLECNKKARAYIRVQLRQTQPNGKIKSADESKAVSCGKSGTWGVSLISDDRPFTEGPAGVWLTVRIDGRDRERSIKKLVQLQMCERCL